MKILDVPIKIRENDGVLMWIFYLGDKKWMKGVKLFNEDGTAKDRRKIDKEMIKRATISIKNMLQACGGKSLLPHERNENI